MTTKHQFILGILLTVLLSVQGCGGSHSIAFTLPYDLKEPDRELELEKELDEISAIASIGNGQLAAIQDESGTIYILSAKSGKVEKEWMFGDNNDFEAMAYHKETFKVITSDGKLWHIPFDNQNPSLGPVSLATESGSEIEGICYDHTSSQYLIAYKTATGISSRDQRNIYKYKDGRKQHARLPYLTISNNRVRDYLEMTKHQKDKLSELLKKTNDAVFQPSDIAVHPLSGHVYLTSAVNELLLVMDPVSGQIVYLHKFSKNDLNQPEGITFDNDGDMYISTEKGSAKHARIIRFDMQPED